MNSKAPRNKGKTAASATVSVAADADVRTGMQAATLKQAGGQVDLKIYPDKAHNIWKVTYDDPSLYQWFLQHQRTKPSRKKTTPKPSTSPAKL